MLIHVTQRHIYAGCAQAVNNCPIALAIIEQTTLDSVYVGRTSIYTESPMFSGSRRIGRLPDLAFRFIIYFDGGLLVAPFSFELPGVQPREHQASLPARDLLHDLNSMRADASRPTGSEEVFEDAAAA